MKNRLSQGGLIDRNRPLTFTFNGAPLEGYTGDTIASALLANDIGLVARSFKYHRPRGIYAAGAEEPHAIFTIGSGGSHTPNVRGTTTPLTDGMEVRSQSGIPSLERDYGAVLSFFSRLLPAGFYYKTFMRPARLWMWYEKFIRRAASSAPAPAEADADSYLHRHAHCDVLIAGGGVAGIAAALAAAHSGADVILADMQPQFGGAVHDGANADADINGMAAAKWVAQSVAALEQMPNVTLLPATTVQGYHDYNYLVAVQEVSAHSENHTVRQILWKIRAARVVVATGAIERPLVFAGNDSPGVMLASAVHAYIHRYAVLAGRNILFFTNNDSAYAAAFAAADAGARVEIADLRQDEGGYWQRQAVDRKVTVHYGCGVISCNKTGGFLSVGIGRIQNDQVTPHISHAYNVVAVSGGWTPTVHLFSQARGALEWSDPLGAFVPGAAHPLNPCIAAGAANGRMDLSGCLRDGDNAGKAAAQQCGCNADADAADTPPPETSSNAVEQAPLYLPYVPTLHPVGRGAGKHFVDLANDVTAADILLAVREGYQSVEHMKRYTAAGFGVEQGKSGNVNALTLLAHALGKKPPEVGHTTYRPQYTPFSFGAVTGMDRRALFAQERRTPIDPWHQRHGAVYEDVGDWKRPRHFPISYENMHSAVWRECKAAREAVAIMDASTLGKIDIQGEDAAQFLDMLYTNLISTLPVGKCRYGLMLRETGMIFDDGVVARLGDNHFHITTSTGHAAGVMNWLEEWLQTEWPHLKVYCTSVTEQWAVIALAGPQARKLLSEVTDLDLSAERFPFMSFQEGTVCGAPARVFRVSFSGETAFEINVPACHGLSVWETLYERGKPHGITPYGTESMHVLRAEKGYIIVGQDSDGTMIPADVGLQWMVSKKKKDFLGKRSLARPDMQRAWRLRLVGLLPADEKTVVEEGTQLLNRAADVPPTDPIGFVTSSYMSPTLERSFALAVVNNGDERMGETIYAATLDGKRVAVTITDTVFYDKEGERLRG